MLTRRLTLSDYFITTHMLLYYNLLHEIVKKSTRKSSYIYIYIYLKKNFVSEKVKRSFTRRNCLLFLNIVKMMKKEEI